MVVRCCRSLEHQKTMKTDLLQEYISLQAALRQERENLVARLQEIDGALGQPSSIGISAPPGARRGHGSNPISLKSAVLQVTANRPMTKNEILEAVERLGYTFR